MLRKIKLVLLKGQQQNIFTLFLENGDTSATGLFLVRTCCANVDDLAACGRVELDNLCSGRI